MTRRMSRWLAPLLIVLFCGAAQAQEKPQKVKIASGGHIVHFLPLDLAVALGYFKDEGLEPEITFLKGGTATAQALISKQVDFSTNSIDHAFKAAAMGKDNLRMVVLLNQTPGMVLVVDSKHEDSVKSIADLTSKRLGVTSRGSATHMVLAFLLSKNGVNTDDVTIVKAGLSTFPPALRNGDIDGGISIEPFASMMVEQGDAFVLQRLITAEDSHKAFGGPYNLAGILTRQDVIDTSPDKVQRLVDVMVRALKWIETHTEEEVAAALASTVVGSDKERYIKTLRLLRGFYSPGGVPSQEGAAQVLAAMKLSGALSSAFNAPPGLFLNPIFTTNAQSDSHETRASGAAVSTPPPTESASSLVIVVVILVVSALAATAIVFYRRRHHG